MPCLNELNTSKQVPQAQHRLARRLTFFGEHYIFARYLPTEPPARSPFSDGDAPSGKWLRLGSQ
jgi:hypothetical protein